MIPGLDFFRQILQTYHVTRHQLKSCRTCFAQLHISWAVLLRPVCGFWCRKLSFHAEHDLEAQFPFQVPMFFCIGFSIVGVMREKEMDTAVDQTLSSAVLYTSSIQSASAQTCPSMCYCSAVQSFG